MRYTKSISSGSLAVAFLSAWAATASPQPDDAQLGYKSAGGSRCHHQLIARHIDVSVERGVGRVSGFMQSDEDLKRAQQDAASVPGVVNVKDELELKREGSRDAGG